MNDDMFRIQRKSIVGLFIKNRALLTKALSIHDELNPGEMSEEVQIDIGVEIWRELGVSTFRHAAEMIDSDAVLAKRYLDIYGVRDDSH